MTRLWAQESEMENQSGLYSLKRQRLIGVGIPIMNLRLSSERLLKTLDMVGTFVL